MFVSFNENGIMLSAILVLLVHLNSQASQTPATKKPCRDHPQLVGACFTVRGRMAYANGAPSVRIWRVGTKRIMGVSEGRFGLPDYENLPQHIEDHLVLDEVDLFADFTVCPFTPLRPGEMQLVCVDSATNLKEQKQRSVR